MTNAAMLFSQMTPPTGERTEFEAWYDEDHIPARMILPGFARATRYWQIPDAGQQAHHLAVYQLDSLNALSTPAYLRLKADSGARTADFLARVSGFTRFTTTCISDDGDTSAQGTVLSVVAFAVPEEDEQEFESWYVEDHVPRLLEARDWLRVHRYRVVSGEGGPWTHLALHELAGEAVMDSLERARARVGPRRDALARRPWFAESGRWLYRAERVQTAG